MVRVENRSPFIPNLPQSLTLLLSSPGINNACSARTKGSQVQVQRCDHSWAVLEVPVAVETDRMLYWGRITLVGVPPSACRG